MGEIDALEQQFADEKELYNAATTAELSAYTYFGGRSPCIQQATCTDQTKNFQGNALPHHQKGAAQTAWCKDQCQGSPAYSVGFNLCRCCGNAGVNNLGF